MRVQRNLVFLVGLGMLACSGKDEAAKANGGASSTAGESGFGGAQGDGGHGGKSSALGGASGASDGGDSSSIAGSAGEGGASGNAGGHAGLGGALGTGGSGISAGAGGSSGAPQTPDMFDASGCVVSRKVPERLSSLLEFVVDISGSMNDRTAATQSQTKWEITHAALLQALSELPSSTGVGMLLYPNLRVVNQSCVNLSAMVPLAALGPADSTARVALTNALANAVPQSLTPTFDAYQAGLEDGLLASQLRGPRSVVLITDGAPTVDPFCKVPSGAGTTQVDPSPILGLIEDAANQGVRTFVVGAPGSEESINGIDARAVWLSKAAQLGGTAAPGCSNSGPNYCHMDLTESLDFGAALRQGLESIADSTASCWFEVPSDQAADPTQLNLVVGAGNGTQRVLYRDETSDCSDGWQLRNGIAALCPAACAAFTADPDATVQVVYGCASVAKP